MQTQQMQQNQIKIFKKNNISEEYEQIQQITTDKEILEYLENIKNNNIDIIGNSDEMLSITDFKKTFINAIINNDKDKCKSLTSKFYVDARLGKDCVIFAEIMECAIVKGDDNMILLVHNLIFEELILCFYNDDEFISQYFFNVICSTFLYNPHKIRVVLNHFSCYLTGNEDYINFLVKNDHFLFLLILQQYECDHNKDYDVISVIVEFLNIFWKNYGDIVQGRLGFSTEQICSAMFKITKEIIKHK